VTVTARGCRRILGCFLAGLLPLINLGATASRAEVVAAPTRYALTEIFALVIPGQILKIDRDGAMAVMENTYPPGPGRPASHVRAYYDLTTGRVLNVDLSDPARPCTESKFSGDWGDAFTTSAGLIAQLNSYHPEGAGAAVVSGIPTRIVEATTPDGRATVWIEPKTGLMVKWTNTPPKGPPQTILEVTALDYAPRPPATFVPPANCPKAANAG
jgi:hypothetical protein